VRHPIAARILKSFLISRFSFAISLL